MSETVAAIHDATMDTTRVDTPSGDSPETAMLLSEISKAQWESYKNSFQQIEKAAGGDGEPAQIADEHSIIEGGR